MKKASYLFKTRERLYDLNYLDLVIWIYTLGKPPWGLGVFTKTSQLIHWIVLMSW
ncbi:hypothetical protein UF75_2324 [Desulfosporosinus sp. I2]|nr:hypothetical protein UF75_2324 [Desulfosporosinus sp. I2]